MATSGIYQEDLAHIHIEGYEFHWKGAAPTVLRWLRQSGINTGRVVDLGCGGGQWLEHLSHEGYDVCGIDLSPSMIRAARQRVPSGQFFVGSFAEIELPDCDAVTSLGEPINYLDGHRSIKRVFRNVFNALRPGGLFIFDAREPAEGPVEPRTIARLGDSWACIAAIAENGDDNSLLRDITTFRKHGNTYRRRSEIHRLKVYSKADTLQWLREAGFRVRCYRGYGTYRFPHRQSAYLARKPL